MSQLRNLLTNKVLRYRGYHKSERKEFFKWHRWQAGIRRADLRKLLRKGN